MGYDKKVVGAEIRRRRLALGLTQEQASEKIDRALRFYARIELGDVGMSVDTLLEICAMLKTTPDSLLLEQMDNDKATDLNLFIESLSNCAPEHQATIIELGRVYLRSLK